MQFSTRAAATAFAALCASGALAEDVNIVALHSLTGGAAFVGAPVVEGMQMAVAESNAAGELGEGRQINLIVADDATDRTQTQSLVTRYGQDPSILAILGPTSGGVAQLGAQVGNEMQVPILPMSNNPEILESGPWAFIMTQTPEDSVSVLADYAAEELGLTNCAVLGVQNMEVYVQLQNTFESHLLEHEGVAISMREAFQSADTDFTSLATKVAYSDVDCVFIASYAAQGAGVVTQLRQAGLSPDVTILGLNVFSSPEFRDIAGAAAEGVYFNGEWVPGGFDDNSRALVERYVAEHGVEPVNWVAVGYGMMRVAIEALVAAGPDVTRESFRDAMVQTRDVPVPIGFGTFSLTEDRRPIYGTYVLKIENGTYVAVSGAPE